MIAQKVAVKADFGFVAVYIYTNKSISKNIFKKNQYPKCIKNIGNKNKFLAMKNYLLVEFFLLELLLFCC